MRFASSGSDDGSSLKNDPNAAGPANFVAIPGTRPIVGPSLVPSAAIPLPTAGPTAGSFESAAPPRIEK